MPEKNFIEIEIPEGYMHEKPFVYAVSGEPKWIIIKLKKNDNKKTIK